MNNQKGISLIITFLVMTAIIAVVLGLVTIVFNEARFMANIRNSISAFYAADTGVEKTLYLIRTSPQTGQSGGIAAGFCGICSTCQGTTNDCTDCTLTPLETDGCDTSCENCKITYSSIFDGRMFEVQATVVPSDGVSIYSNGYYNNAIRNSQFRLFPSGCINCSPTPPPGPPPPPPGGPPPPPPGPPPPP